MLVRAAAHKMHADNNELCQRPQRAGYGQAVCTETSRERDREMERVEKERKGRTVEVFRSALQMGNASIMFIGRVQAKNRIQIELRDIITSVGCVK